jgi:DNA repair protein RecN (Recombination protein N)
MLQSLHIKNFALVDELSIDFRARLNVITGETGAGKSILMGALALLLGDRADKTVIRSGETTCTVQAVFQLEDPAPVLNILEEYGLEQGDDSQLIIRRIVSASGSNKNFVNDCPTTLQVLKVLGEVLVDMHGPYDHQSLLSPMTQLDILDSFAQLTKQRAEYHDAFKQLKKLKERLHELGKNDQDIVQKVDMLRYQIDEIENADVKEGEEEEVLKEHQLAANSQNIMEAANQVMDCLTDGESPASDSMRSALRALSQLTEMMDEASEWREEADSIATQINELASTISSRVSQVESDPQRLEWLDDRLALYSSLKRKYGGSVDAIMAHLESSRSRLNDLENREEELAKVQKAIDLQNETVMKLGRALRKKRLSASDKLAKLVTSELADLGFAHAVFSIDLEESVPTPTGLDNIEYGFAPNPGETMRALRAIASSGEISRVMLAVKSVLANYDKIPVLVFDEIDANLGGETGNAVGVKMQGVAGSHQVLCITHLPQVAVHGHAHYVVSKSVKGDRTSSQILEVRGDERAEEIARMLGGKNLTSMTLDHAREMLENAVGV